MMKGGDADWENIATAAALNAVTNPEVLNRVIGAIPGLGGVMGMLGADGTSASSVLGQYLGAIPNPSIALIFAGPTLREFGFSWRFHPTSASESKTLQAILKRFKREMLPNLKFKNALNMLGYPRVCEVKLYPDEFLFPMKGCAVTNITINNAPNGVPTFFEGTNAPTSIEFSLFLREIEYFLSEDFGGVGGTADLKDYLNEDIINGAGAIAETATEIAANPTGTEEIQ